MESATIPYLTRCVALLAEGVDRNREDTRYLTHYIVALLAEGVDRNSTNSESTICRVQSPSSRRAWIEMKMPHQEVREVKSPSSRRAWIEMPLRHIHVAHVLGRPPRGGRG